MKGFEERRGEAHAAAVRALPQLNLISRAYVSGYGNAAQTDDRDPSDVGAEAEGAMLHDRWLLDLMAEVIYGEIPYDEAGEKPQWVQRGNSIRQDDARAAAVAYLLGEIVAEGSQV